MKILCTVGIFVILTAWSLHPITGHATDNTIFNLVEDGDVKKVEAFIVKNPNATKATKEDGSTPLHVLAKFLRFTASVTNVARSNNTTLNETTPEGTALAALLIAKGVEIDARDNNGCTALHWAISQTKYNLAEYLIEKGADVNAIIQNEPGVEGASPLHLAAGRGHIHLVSLLLSKGANPIARTKGGQTPADVAALYKHEEVLKVLMSAIKP